MHASEGVTSASGLTLRYNDRMPGLIADKETQDRCSSTRAWRWLDGVLDPRIDGPGCMARHLSSTCRGARAAGNAHPTAAHRPSERPPVALTSRRRPSRRRPTARLTPRARASQVSAESVLEGMRLRCEAPQDTLHAASEQLKFDLARYFEDQGA